MKRCYTLLVAVFLSACGDRPASTAGPAAEIPPTETVEFLLANPERHKTLRDQCRVNRAEVGDELCNIVGEANNKAFLGDGEVPYTPPEDPPAF